MTDYASLVGTLPDLGTQWLPVAAQLQSEGASTDQINYLRDSYADTVSQITNVQLSSGGQIDPQAAMQQAAGFITASQTALGAVQNVVGLVSTAVHASSPAQALQAANMITGTLIAAATAAGALSAGVGAVIVAGVGLAASVIGDLLSGSPPAATVCGTNLSTKPSIVVNCAFTGGLANTPGAPAWRPFPDPSVAGDNGWFQPGQGISGYYIARANWRGDWWSGSFTSSPARLIDQAFPDYAQIAGEQPDPSATGMILDFKRAFFAAWQANQAYALNGLIPRPSEELLFHFVNVWNRAHSNTEILNLAPGDTGTGVDYEASLIKDLAHQNFPNVPIVNGRLQIYLGPRLTPAVSRGYTLHLTLRPPATAAPAPSTAKTVAGVSAATVGSLTIAAIAISLVKGKAWDWAFGQAWAEIKDVFDKGGPHKFMTEEVPVGMRRGHSRRRRH